MNDVSSAAAVVIAGAWQAFEGIWWDVCKLTGAIMIGLAVLAGALLAACTWIDRRHPPTVIVFGAMPDEPCPCCTGRPFEVDDCTCREPCGESWCQANDVGDDTIAEFGPEAELEREIDDMVRKYGNG